MQLSSIELPRFTILSVPVSWILARASGDDNDEDDEDDEDDDDEDGERGTWSPFMRVSVDARRGVLAFSDHCPDNYDGI